MRSQSSAQAEHTSAQTPHVSEWYAEPPSMKSALVWQIWAQSSSNRTWTASACLPPMCRQCCAVSIQIEWHSWQFCMHSCICALWIMKSSVESRLVSPTAPAISVADVQCLDHRRDCRSFPVVPTHLKMPLSTGSLGWIGACPTGTRPSAC